MKKETNFFSPKIINILLLFLYIFSINSATVYEINQSVDGKPEYKKVEFSGDPRTLNHYFKYTFNTIPSSKISAFRIHFDEFNPLSIERNKVFCTFVDDSSSDNDLINTVGLMDDTTSSCKGAFTNGFYNGIIEHDNSKKKLAIYLVTLGAIDFTARLYLRTTEYILPVTEGIVSIDEEYSVIPVTIIISHFREKASKVLFYSYTRELQMYYTEENTPYPERLFFGNIMSVYTNPNMVRQKYKNADTMILLIKPFGTEDIIGEQFQFQVKFFSSNYLLDYYMGSNLQGRSKNTPLAINMTECVNPYYVILNYNVPEKQTSLYIDEIYGKIKSLSVAPTLSSSTWDKMTENDMQLIDTDTRKFVLPANSESHIDVYKVECEVPLLLNFYYIDESASIPELDYGHVAITTLKSYKSYSLPFASGVVGPQLTIEVFNPIKDPFVIIDDGQNEKIITKNSVIRSIPFTTNNPVVLKERNGDSNSRVIIKVGYNTGSWTTISENVVYNVNLNMYVFSFPADDDKYNYTSALLKTSGTNSEDNVKYCYGTNIGSAVLPSSENCYRVSHDNSYTIKVLNPLVMYKDYDMEEDLVYYVSLRPTNRGDTFDINADLIKYDTNERNFEGIGNNLVLNNGKESTILTSPQDRDEYILVQIQSCDNSKLTFGVYDGYDNNQLVSDTDIPAGEKHYYKKYKNTFLETEVKLSGNSGTKVYVKHTGITNSYTPSIKESFPLSFNQNLNQLIVENPLTTSERMNYTVYVGRQGELSSQGLTICSFAEKKTTIATYNQTFVSFSDKTTFNINFNKIGLKKGDQFEAIAFIEQEPNSKLSFVTEVLTGTVGEIETKSITEISTEDSTDPDYVYVTKTAKSDEMTYYFSYLPTKVFNMSVGALRIEVESDETGPFNRIACAFVNEEDDANSMVEAVEEIASQYNSYCVGGRSRTNGKIYNFLFKYSYTNDATPKPRKLVIKLNNNEYNGNFNIYVRKGDNVYLEHTDFEEQKEYGKQEEFKKSIIPYIIDLETIRGESETDYISKILIYSQHLEMQMYYLDPSGEINNPMLLFTGNIMLVYTKLTLAEQKYHATKLVLLSENLNGQEHSAVGITFRFHTKMFRSEDQIEYFVSNNPTGRTLNFPLSIEMNTCTSTNNKYYYILNYNQPEEERILYLDSVFGIIKNARIANEINAERWDSLLTNSMTEITDYTFTLSEKSQHIDVLEIECTTPLLTNIYYNYKGQVFSGLGRGDIVVKNLGPRETFSFTLVSGARNFYYSISTFNPKENPDLTFRFDNVQLHQIIENSLTSNFLLSMPYRVSVENNKNTDTRFIFKIGYGVESEWIDEEEENIQGKLYSSGSQFVYKFPSGVNRRNFTNVILDVKPMKKDSQELAENVKFCYSTSLGMAINPSQENCYRTGANIPYSLTFINPLIAPKNYKSLTDNYYVTITPFTQNEYISLGITENKYDVTDRNIEGINKVLEIGSEREKSTILSIPEVITNTQIVVQLQACVASIDQIDYVNKNAYSGDVISTGTIKPSRKEYYYLINNILMETEIKFTGVENDLVFVKHTGITDYEIVTQYYYSTFDINENTVTIIKPIYNEKFRITVLVGEPGRFSNYSLCTLAQKSESDYINLADYAKTFISESSNTITHFIDFRSFSYRQGQKFDLLVYAVQEENSKLEFLFEVISGTVGEIKGIIEIEGRSEDGNYATQEFTQNRTTNYLFYDFSRNPIGDVASLKIINSEEGMRVNKVGCVFVKKNTEDVDMVSAVNLAMMEGNSVCYGQTEKDTNGFDALINAKDVKNGYQRIVIQILYGFGENNNKDKKVKNGKLSEEGYIMTINIRPNGFEVDTQNSQYNEKEELTVMPYVFDLIKIRESQEGENYISKVMVYSSTREMQMFYIGDSGAPTELFSGNIMLVYTNPDVINEKYHGANIMILLTDSLSNSGKETIGEVFRFKTYFFKSDNTMQYYVSPNPDGRLLNKPTLIEMNSCDVPYYYILNYNFPEEDNRILHIDNIFGEINTMKIANQLNKNDWYDLIREMEEFSGNEYLIEGQTNYHMDVIEVTCKIPSLLNIYYVDENNPNYSNLDLSDIAILNLSPTQNQKLTFKSNLDGEFIYTFNVFLETGSPDIGIKFEDEENEMRITENGVFTKNSNVDYEYITITNKKISGNTKTKIIFKFGYSIDNIFTKINNNIYQYQKENKTVNLFAYKFNTGEDRLNTTSINFRVSTNLENVKFCYTTNLGSFVEPSSQNCYRVGRTNSYTISVLNPYIMYKNYKFGDDKNILDYYVSFRTENSSHNITIYPSLNNYTTINRNLEGHANAITIAKNGSTILTSPKTNMLFVHIHVCTVNRSISYNFKNAYNSSSLNMQGQITANTKNNFMNVPNIKLDTELALESDSSAEVFINHIGLNEKYTPVVYDIVINYDGSEKLTFNQPIDDEEFKYTLYLDKQGNLLKQNYTLCSFTKNSKFAYYSTNLVSKEKNMEITLDFDSKVLKDYTKFDILILAEQVNNGKLMILSDLYQGEKKKKSSSSSSNLVLVIVIVILTVLLVAGGITAFILLRRYKLKPDREKLDAKETSLTMVDNKNEKMMTSTATQNND